jgi:hypothetical protein
MSEFIILHGCRTLQLTQGFNTLIDEEDFIRAGYLKWNIEKSRRHSLCYARRLERMENGKMKAVHLHRIILDFPDCKHIDHRNRDGLDNRRCNLRPASTTQNFRNRAKLRGESKFKGVHRNRTRWVACICVDKKRIILGRFSTEQQAARAYDNAARERFGEFARTNVDMFGDY